MKINYSETFYSFQGEGLYTGKITNWVRYWGCNLTCRGFSQEDPCDSSTWIDPLATVDLSKITNIKDLPVPEVGCDSEYSHRKEFRDFSKKATEKEMADELINLNKSETNPEGLFTHPLTNEPIHLAFTGGESMMSQEQTVAIMEELVKRNNYPKFVTFETNGTKVLKPVFIEWFNNHQDIEVLFSVSPKLQTVSGELPKKAWKPEIFTEYSKLVNNSITQVKFVVYENEKSKQELLTRTSEIKDENVYFYVMPLGAKLEQQEEVTPDFYNWLIANGFNVSMRVHVFAFGNAIGT